MAKYYILLTWALVTLGAFQSQSFRTYSCSEVGLTFKLPNKFTPLDKNAESKLAERGAKAEKEVFRTTKIRTWQPTCITTLAAGRSVIFSALSIPFAVLQQDYKSYTAFLDYYFREQKYFLEARSRSKGLLTDKLEATRKDLKIAGLWCQKMKLVMPVNQSNLVYLCYLFRIKDNVYQFAHIGKSLDLAESIEKGIEQAVPLK